MKGAGRLDAAARKRLDNCLALAKRGATPGERAAGKAAAERIAASAGLTLAEAKAQARGVPAGSSDAFTPGPTTWAPSSRQRARPRTKPRKPTVADKLREKAEYEAARRRRADRADRRFAEESAEYTAWAEQQRVEQAERDRAWAARRAAPAAQGVGAHP